MTSRQTEPLLCVEISLMFRSLVNECKTNIAMKQNIVQFVDIGMEYPVHEADAGAFVRILIRQLDVDLPETALEWSCSSLIMYSMTFFFS